MIGKRRLTKQTLGVFMDTGHAASIPTGAVVEIPAGAVIEIPNAPAEGTRTVDVICDGKNLMMFTSDLRDRSLEIDT